MKIIKALFFQRLALYFVQDKVRHKTFPSRSLVVIPSRLPYDAVAGLSLSAEVEPIVPSASVSQLHH